MSLVSTDQLSQTEVALAQANGEVVLLQALMGKRKYQRLSKPDGFFARYRSSQTRIDKQLVINANFNVKLAELDHNRATLGLPALPVADIV